MKKLKKLTAVLLSAIMAFSVFAVTPITASAAEHKYVDISATTVVVGGSSKSDAEEIDFSVTYGVELPKEETRWFKFTTNDSDSYWYNLSVKDISVGSHNQGGSGISGKILDFFDEQYSYSDSRSNRGAKLEKSTVYYVAIYGCRAGNIKFQLDAEYDEFSEIKAEAKSIDFGTSYESRIDSGAGCADDRTGNGIDGDVDYVKFYTGKNTKVKFTLTNVDINYYNTYFEGVVGIVHDNLNQRFGYIEVSPNGEKSVEMELEENTYYYIKIFATSGGVGNYSFKIETNDIIVGDSNGDGRVSVLDATLIQKYSASIEELSGDKLNVSDVNKDGVVNVLDATEIQKYLADLPSVLA